MRRTVLAVLFVLSLGHLFSQSPLRVTTIDYPPFYIDADSGSGIACDILSEIFRSEAVEIEFAFVPPLRMVRGIEDNITLCGLGSTLADNSGLIVSEALYTVRQVFIYDTRKFPAGISFEELSDLNGYRIGVLDKSATAEHLGKHGLTVVLNMNSEGLAKQLHNGRVDLWAAVDISALLTLERQFRDEYGYFACTKPFQESEINLIIPKALDYENGYSAAIGSGLEKLKKSGRYAEIENRYLPTQRERAALGSVP